MPVKKGAASAKRTVATTSKARRAKGRSDNDTSRPSVRRSTATTVRLGDATKRAQGVTGNSTQDSGAQSGPRPTAAVSQSTGVTIKRQRPADRPYGLMREPYGEKVLGLPRKVDVKSDSGYGREERIAIGTIVLVAFLVGVLAGWVL